MFLLKQENQKKVGWNSRQDHQQTQFLYVLVDGILATHFDGIFEHILDSILEAILGRLCKCKTQ